LLFVRGNEKGVALMNTAIQVLMLMLVLTAIFSLVAFGLLILHWRRPTRRTHVIRFLVAVALLPCIIAMLNWSVAREYIDRVESARTERNHKVAIVQVGEPLPDFAVTDSQGTRFSVSDAKGKVLLINFFATWCGPCRKELPHIEKIWDDNRESMKLQVLIIGVDETLDSVKRFGEENKMSLPFAPDPDGEIFRLFVKPEASIPRTIIVSPKGEIVYAKGEFYDRDIHTIRSVIARQLAGLH
jgi:peroxiredoxin